MRLRQGLSISLLALLLGMGCGRSADMFRTPYDRELTQALRKQKGGWVVQGSSALDSPLQSVTLQPGQFLRVVLETPQPFTEEVSGWLVVRMDTLRIYEDSLVYLPWAGAVRVGGLSVDSAQKVLEAVARRTFIGAHLRIYPLYPYYIFGQVPQPGRILLDKQAVPLIEVLPFLSPQLRQGDFSKLKVLRGIPSASQVFLVDARNAATLTGDFYLRTGDILVVEPRNAVRLRIEVENYMAVLGVLQLLNIVLIVLFRFV